MPAATGIRPSEAPGLSTACRRFRAAPPPVRTIVCCRSSGVESRDATPTPAWHRRRHEGAGAAGRCAQRAAQARHGDRVPLWVIPQHPVKTPDPVEVKVKAPLNAGPVGSERRGLRLRPQSATGSSRRRSPTDRALSRAIKAAIRISISSTGRDRRARASTSSRFELGRLLTWGFEASRLIVLPHAGLPGQRLLRGGHAQPPALSRSGNRRPHLPHVTRSTTSSRTRPATRCWTPSATGTRRGTTARPPPSMRPSGT